MIEMCTTKWCADGECIEGHTGKDCARCEDGWWTFQGTCRECPENNDLSFVVGCGLAILLSLLAFGAARTQDESDWHGKSMAIVSMFLTHFQVVVLFFSFNIDRPIFLYDLVDWGFKIFSFDFIELASPECSIGSISFPIMWAIKTGSPLVLIAPLIMVALLGTKKEGQAMWNCVGAMCCLVCFYVTLPLGMCAMCVQCIRACCTLEESGPAHSHDPDADPDADPESGGGAITTQPENKKPEKVRMQSIKVRLPAGAKPGTTVELALPRGPHIQVAIPARVKEGSIINVKLPMGPKAKKVEPASKVLEVSTAKNTDSANKFRTIQGFRGGAARNSILHTRHAKLFNTRAIVGVVILLNATYILMMRSAASVLPCTDGVLKGRMVAAPQYVCGGTAQLVMATAALFFLFCGFVVVNIGIYDLAALNKRVDAAVRYDMRDGALWWGPATNIFKLVAVLTSVLLYDSVDLECAIMLVSTAAMAVLSRVVKPHEEPEDDKTFFGSNNNLEFLLYTNQAALVLTLLCGHRGLLSKVAMGVALAVLYFFAFVLLLVLVKVNYALCMKGRRSGLEDPKAERQSKALLDGVKALVAEHEARKSFSADQEPPSFNQKHRQKPPDHGGDDEGGDHHQPHRRRPSHKQHHQELEQQQYEVGEAYGAAAHHDSATDSVRVRVPSGAKQGGVVAFKVGGEGGHNQGQVATVVKIAQPASGDHHAAAVRPTTPAPATHSIPKPPGPPPWPPPPPDLPPPKATHQGSPPPLPPKAVLQGDHGRHRHSRHNRQNRLSENSDAARMSRMSRGDALAGFRKSRTDAFSEAPAKVSRRSKSAALEGARRSKSAALEGARRSKGDVLAGGNGARRSKSAALAGARTSNGDVLAGGNGARRSKSAALAGARTSNGDVLAGGNGARRSKSAALAGAQTSNGDVLAGGNGARRSKSAALEGARRSKGDVLAGGNGARRSKSAALEGARRSKGDVLAESRALPSEALGVEKKPSKKKKKKKKHHHAGTSIVSALI